MNTDRINTTRELTIDQIRIETLATLAAVCRVGGLPAPKHVDMLQTELQTEYHRCLELRMNDDDRDGVRRWAAHLGIGPADEKRIGEGRGSFTSVKAQSQGDEPGWLGWQWVEVWSACDREAGV